MRILALFSAVLFSWALSYAPYTYADEAIATMANIVIGLKHFPSASDKAALGAIADSESEDTVKAIASAIANIAHKVTDADKATLNAIIADGDTPAELRELAAVLISFSHMPSADAVSTLNSLANP